MKATIVFEDTPQGMVLDLAIEANGCQDHPADSLSVIRAAILQDDVLKAAAKGTLRLIKPRALLKWRGPTTLELKDAR